MAKPAALQAPTDLDAKSKTLWNRVREYLIELGMWENTDAELVSRYVRAVELAKDAREQMGSHLVVRGAQGQPVANPLVRVAQGADRDAHAYAVELCLSPRARKQLEIGRKAKGGGKFGL